MNALLPLVALATLSLSLPDPAHTTMQESQAPTPPDACATVDGLITELYQAVS
jgi:hypothetical protein